MPTLLLMENAARGIASVVIEGLQGLRGATVCVVCGPGNNGGDGLALARHLSNRGVKVGVVLSGTAGAYTGDARVNMTIVERMGLPVVECAGDAAKALDAIAQAIGEPHLIVDALLGTGADRPATGSIASLINAINTQHEAGVSVLSVDLPSGMDADTGKPCEDDRGVGPCVRADLTVSLAGVKIGFLGAHAQEYAGELVVVDIGVPTQVLERFGTPMNRHAHALG